MVVPLMKKFLILHVGRRRISVIRINSPNYVITRSWLSFKSQGMYRRGTIGQNVNLLVNRIKFCPNSLKDLYPFFYSDFKGAD